MTLLWNKLANYSDKEHKQRIQKRAYEIYKRSNENDSYKNWIIAEEIENHLRLEQMKELEHKSEIIIPDIVKYKIDRYIWHMRMKDIHNEYRNKVKSDIDQYNGKTYITITTWYTRYINHREICSNEWIRSVEYRIYNFLYNDYCLSNDKTEYINIPSNYIYSSEFLNQNGYYHNDINNNHYPYNDSDDDWHY